MLENSLNKLKVISDKLVVENTSLEEGIKLFESGVEILEQCAKALGECKGKVSVLKSRLAALDDIFGED